MFRRFDDIMRLLSRKWKQQHFVNATVKFVPHIFNTYCYIAGHFLPTARALIGYFEVTWHLTMKLFPAKISEEETLQILWRQRVQCTVIRECWPLARFIFTNLYTKKFFFVVYITNHLKTGPSGNSWFCWINSFPRDQSLSVYKSKWHWSTRKTIEYRTLSADPVTWGGLLPVTSLSPSVSSSV